MLNSEIGQKPKFRIKLKAVPGTPATPKTSADRLAALVETSIASDPHELNGNQWCQLSHADRAVQLGMTERTIRRLIQSPPFVRTTRGNTTYVRVGEPSPEDRNRETAIILTEIWDKHLKANVAPMEAALKAEIETLKATLKTAKGAERKEALALRAKREKALNKLHIQKTTPDEFGLLNGLVGAWPEGLAVELFKLVLAEWAPFMSAAKIAHIENPPPEGKVYARDLEDLHFKFVNLSVLRLFAYVAVDMLVMKYQAQGYKAVVPAALVALNPPLWQHLKAKKG